MKFDNEKSIRRRRLSHGLICSRFDHLTDFEHMSNSLFPYEKLITCFVLMIGQISIVRRFDDLTHSDRLGSNFVKSSKRRTTNSSVIVSNVIFD